MKRIRRTDSHSGQARAYGYNAGVDEFREREYPMLKGRLSRSCRDHAICEVAHGALLLGVMSSLLGNPHSASASSQLTTSRIEDIRLRVLRFFNADPEDFDVVFVHNATAGIKLVMEAFKDVQSELSGWEGDQQGFWYGYHRDSHTSLVGVRETASAGSRCFYSDDEVNMWLLSDRILKDKTFGLFAYPAQSNMNGRRLPLDWCERLREKRFAGQSRLYSLLDAASLVSTSPLDLSNSGLAPDFTVLSFYKIFGFPDLGALIVRKESGDVLQRRKYFGGGTVEVVLSSKEQWHVKKEQSLHDQLEDGTLPFHSIIALDAAMDTHQKLYGSMEKITQHTSSLARQLYDGLFSLRHGNGGIVCQMHKDESSEYDDPTSQGPIIAFNIRNSKGGWVSNAEVEKLAIIRKIHLRTGGVCNPGGVASSLGLAPWEMKRNFSAGLRCGDDNDIMGGKPTGIIRVSLGAMSTTGDVETFVDFVKEFFCESNLQLTEAMLEDIEVAPSAVSFQVESLMIYPIKSCAGWRIPPLASWEIRCEGLAWDREWCLVHLGSGTALSQKRYPKMALIRPSIDLVNGVLRVGTTHTVPELDRMNEITVPLSADPAPFRRSAQEDVMKSSSSRVCGDDIKAQLYTSPEVSRFFSKALGVPCTLARFPVGGSGPSVRHAKAHLQQHQLKLEQSEPGNDLENQFETGALARPILLSNESPILTISRSSLNRLNEQIKHSGGKAARADVFRANIVLRENIGSALGSERPYVEDSWRYLRIGEQYFQMLGACRRCHMVCVDQETAEKNEEPFLTLAKTRRFDGKVFFGCHSCHLPITNGQSPVEQNPTIRTGDPVTPFLTDEVLV